MVKLRRRREFEAVLASPRQAVVSPLFVVRLLARPDGPARLGIVASRKALARAVDRNRAKRLVREAFRAAQRDLPPADIVVQVRGALVRARRAATREDLAAVFKRIAHA
jgi:ribonuclease P protein component